MTSEGVVLNIHEMIDLAIGTPEVGVVDFCMLQTLLHCLAQQMRCSEKTVELKGNVGILPVGRIPEGAPTLAISELPLETDGVPAEAPGGGQDTILIVERVARGSSGGGKAGTGRVESSEPRSAQRADAASKDVAKSGAKGGKASGKGKKGSKGTSTEDFETGDTSDEDSTAPDGKAAGKAGAVAVPKAAPVTTAGTGLPPASLVTLSKFNLLESAVNDLKDRVYGSMPKNDAILEEVRSQTNIKAITDLWTNLNVSSRLEAAEGGISKLSSLLQDLIRSTADPTLQSKAEAIAPGTDAPGTTSLGASGPGADTPGAVHSAPGYTDPAASAACIAACENKVVALVNELQELRLDHDQLSNTFHTAMKQMDQAVGPPRQRGAPGITLESLSTPAGTTTTSEVDKGQKSPISSLPVPGVPGAGIPGSGAPISDAALAAKVAALASRLDEIEKKQYQLHADVFNPNLGSLQEQISSLQDQIDYFTKHAAGGMPPPTSVPMGEGLDKLPPELAKDLQGLMQLFQTVQGMQNQLREVHDTALQLAAEKEEKQHNIKSLLEQIELLKSIKLDREDMVEALADKADLRLLARKVSHDQFEMACDDLSKGLEHAFGKLNVQESLWQQALDDIQREIEMKLDKLELAPVKEFFNNKLKQLQENLKQMADLRKQAQAAGTKRKLLMDVNCISCDANAVMETVHTAGGGPRPLPAHMSIKPYLSYELDAIRKAQQSNLSQRNLHDWETINKTPSPQKQPHKVRSDTDKHICNRYCGGSHTTTTPAQRVARTGHFVKQWGPEVLPLSSEFATGDDGRLYKVTASKPSEAGPGGAADAPCTPRSKSKEQQKLKPLGISPECRCLEERLPK